MDIKVLGSGSKGNAYTVSDGETALLIECGLTWRRLQEALKYRVTDIDACLVTHEHKDHSASAQKLAEAGIDVYMSAGTKQALDPLNRRFRTLPADTIGTFRVRHFDVNHDAIEPVGYHITSLKTGETLVFITDTSHVNYYFKGVDYWLVEINYIKRIMDANIGVEVDLSRRNRTVLSHMALETAVAMLEASGAHTAKHIYAMHLSDANSSEREIRETLQATFGVPVTIC